MRGDSLDACLGPCEADGAGIDRALAAAITTARAVIAAGVDPTKGTAGYAQTWEFFRNTLLSGGLFTGLFVGAMKLTAAAESAREKEAPENEAEAESAPDVRPEEAKA